MLSKWTYVNVRSGEARNSVFIWTAIVEETDGRRWADYEVGVGTPRRS